MAVVVTFKDDTVNATPLEGVVAQFTQDDHLVVQSTSNGDGEVTVVLSAGTYHILVACPELEGYSITNPYEIVITSGNETYEIEVGTFSYPTGTGCMCRCSGYLRDARGQLMPDARIYLNPIDIPLLYGNTGFFPIPIEFVITNGYGSIDLIRGGVYLVVSPGIMTEYKIVIPDRSWAPLPDVLFPTPFSVTFNPPSLAMEVGDTTTVSVSVLFRSGLTLSGADLFSLCGCCGGTSPVTFVSSDENVITAGLGTDGNLTVSAIGAGSASITAERSVVDGPIYVYTEPAIGGSLGATVTSG